MTVSDKQLSIGIILLVFLGVIGYVFFWFGYIEIFINHADVESFELKSREKTYKCEKNPCRIKIRASRRFSAEVVSPFVSSQEMVYVSRVPLFKTEKLIVQPKQEVVEALVKEIPIDKFLKQRNLQGKINIIDKIGPILANPDKSFFIFARKIKSGVKIFIKNEKSEQLLTTIYDNFSEIFLEKNFSLTNNGIVVPAQNRVYFFDLSTQTKIKLAEINSLRISNISVSNSAEEAIFFNLKEEKWEKRSTVLESSNSYSKNVFFAGFWGSNEVKIAGDKLFINEKVAKKISRKINSKDEFFIEKDNLFVRQDFGVLEISLN